jgi:hypothetical protein
MGILVAAMRVFAVVSGPRAAAAADTGVNGSVVVVASTVSTFRSADGSTAPMSVPRVAVELEGRSEIASRVAREPVDVDVDVDVDGGATPPSRTGSIWRGQRMDGPLSRIKLAGGREWPRDCD